MAYSTQIDILNQMDQVDLIRLTDDDNLGTVDADRVTRAIADADEEIDGYLGTRMTVPLETVPGIIRKASVDIAIFNLYSRRQDTLPEVRQKRYDNAVKFLVKVAEGKITLGQSDPDGNPPETGSVDYSGSDQVMTATKLDRF